MSDFVEAELEWDSISLQLYRMDEQQLLDAFTFEYSAYRAGDISHDTFLNSADQVREYIAINRERTHELDSVAESYSRCVRDFIPGSRDE